VHLRVQNKVLQRNRALVQNKIQWLCCCKQQLRLCRIKIVIWLCKCVRLWYRWLNKVKVVLQKKQVSQYTVREEDLYAELRNNLI
jgi:hypothetical protein